MGFVRRTPQHAPPRDIPAEVAAADHVATAVERYTTLPTSELQTEVEVLKIEERIASNLDEAHRPLLGALRGARLLEKTDEAEILRTALELVAEVQRRFAEQRGEQ
jgi:hypothetical protein